MRLQTVRTIVLDAAILAALGVGGWFVGAAVFAHEAGTARPIEVVADRAGASTSDGTIVVPSSGLSPFGQHSGLPGRQVLVGRVTEVGDGFFVAATPAGETTFQIGEDSTFLLRLMPGSAADVEPGATIAVLTDGESDGAVVARSVLVLPPGSRPQIQAPPPPAFDPGQVQEEPPAEDTDTAAGETGDDESAGDASGSDAEG